MRKLKLLTFILLSVVTLASCNNKEDDKKVQPENPRGKVLMNGSWLLVEAYKNTEKNGVYKTYDLFKDLDSCAKDDLVTFSKEHEVVIDQEGVMCDESAPKTKVDEHWALTSNSYIEFTNVYFESTYEAQILELSEETLHYRVTGLESDGTTFESTYKYSKAH